ncbi:MAG: hypothetical protein ACTHKU_13245 [Verrucomicrobiota bacterium]
MSDTQTLLAGASASFGPNGSGGKTDTQIYGLDAYRKWKPANTHAGFPFVSWQSEALLRRYQAGAFAGDSSASPAVAAVRERPATMATRIGRKNGRDLVH